MSINKTIAKDASIIGFATLCSRLLGFIRDVVIARLFGVYLYAQAFVIAFRIPNLFRDLVGEGATNAALVPVFSEYTIKHNKEEFWGLTNVVLNLLLVILMGITILGVLFSPLIVRLIAPGFIADPHKLETTIRLARLIFPYILLISLSAYSMAILNSLRHFSLPAFAPCLLNISIIIFAIMYGEEIKGLALGVLVGGALQLLVQLPLLYKKGFRPKIIWRPQQPAAKLIAKLMLPRLLSTSVYQLNNFVDSIFGSMARIVGEGGVAVLYFAYRLILFPIGIFTNALAQAILPTLSTQALDEDQQELKDTLSFGLLANFFVMLPATVGFMILAKPIISTLFGGGRFDAYSTQMTSSVLFYYSIGLCAYGTTKILQSCFFALKDTLTPAKVSILALIINIILNIILMFPMKLAGLALATSLSGITTCTILFFILRKKLKAPLALKELLSSFLRILFASLAMGLVVTLAVKKQVFFQNVFWEKVTNLGLPILAGISSYIIFCFIFRVEEIRQVWGWLRNAKEV